MSVRLSHYRGSVLAGACGDALGAPVEFMSAADIRHRFGAGGIRDFAPAYGRVGAITDDTQMMMFTARGLLATHAAGEWNDDDAVAQHLHRSYLDWLATQNDPDARRGPGRTCLSALRSGLMGTVHRRLNDSKGCGGVMRVAPVGLSCPGDPDRARRLGILSAAITHGHPGGYHSAGALAAVLARLAVGVGLESAVKLELPLTADAPTRDLVAQACRLAASDRPLDECLAGLGEGWVGDQALAIGVLCALRHPADLEAALIAAASHSGDSDSTAMVTGNLLGLALGASAIPSRWLESLEAADEIERLAIGLWEAFGVSRRR